MAIQRNDDHWVWVGGPVPPGAAAITVWRVISVRRANAGDVHLMRHEREHLAQWRRLGVGRFLAQYLGAYLRGRAHGYGHADAYRLIPLEVEAEQAAVDAAHLAAAAGDPGHAAASGTDPHPPLT